MARLLRVAILLTCLLSARSAFAAGGACPSGVPTTGNNCYFIAANGSDSNNGTSESTPWLHAPGMPNCSANCAALSAGNGGMGIILRGGDTWHFGNGSGLTPHAGGAWDLYNWFGNAYGGNFTSNCVYEGSQTGCLYVGVDPTWYSGSSWTRPILTGDNPLVVWTGTLSTSFASSCAYQISGNDFGTNNLVVVPAYTIIDSFELTGLCVSAAGTSSGNTYFAGWSYGGSASPVISILENCYMHGWSATSTAGTGSASHPVTVLAGGGGVFQVLDHNVIDGSDSNPEVVAWGSFPWFYHVRDNIVRYVGQGVGAQCHDIHDNIFEHFYYTELDGHINILECNHDAGPNQSPATSTPNVLYNNIMRHNDPSVGNAEGFWFCPNTNPEYWFNNLIYDAFPPGQGQPWAIAGSSQYSDCTNTGGQFMSNNTFVDQTGLPCGKSGSAAGLGAYLTAYNNHLINSTWDSTTPRCVGADTSATNVSMSTATAATQGYTTGSGGTVGNTNTCANDTTKPCSPKASSNGTVGMGTNLQSYCTTLASYTSEYAIGTEAANACQYGTTDGCSYNATTHTMNCPAQTAVARPTSGVRDSGAYQFSGSQAQAPQAPTGLQATVQ